MADSYVTSNAMLQCNQGTTPSQLTVLPTRTVNLSGQPMANISDHTPMLNIMPFGMCRSLANPTVASATAAAQGVLTPMPCIPNTQIPWMGGKMDCMVKGQPALLKSSTCQCLWAGSISIIFDGQMPPLPADVLQMPREMFRKSSEKSEQPEAAISEGGGRDTSQDLE